MKPLRVFISSVQKEVELERATVAGLIATDPFLLQHCRPAKKPYLEALRGCAIYVLIIANEYGRPDGEISATHHEYRLAQRLKLHTIVFLKGAQDEVRTAEARALIECRKAFEVTYNTAYLDLSKLVELKLLVQVGKGRATRYQPGSAKG